MTRYRWYKLHSQRDFQSIIEKMKSMPFSVKNIEGFQIDDFFENKIFSQFLYVRPFDNEGETLSIVEIVDFVLFKIKDSLFLRIRNPGHGIKKLGNTLLDICGYPFALEQININFSDCESLIQHYKFESKVTLVKINNLFLSKDIESEMTFKSPNGVDLSQLEFLANKNYQKTQMVWSINIDETSYNLSVLSSGLINISEYLTFDVLDYIETVYLYKYT